jgi:tetratricopeptide (TPR) repeat protein
MKHPALYTSKGCVPRPNGRSLLSGAIGKLLPVLLLASSLTLAPSIQAALDPAVENLNQLITENRYEEAYTLSRQMLAEFEGDPEFDFLFGLAALEAGRPNEAVFAFERLAFQYPDQQRVKLELARAFFQTNNLAASRQLFTEVLDSNPEENVRVNVQAFLEQIDEREQTIAGSLSWYVNTNMGHDSNINSATELGIISTPIGDVELSPSGQSLDDSFMDLGTGFNFVNPLTKTSALNFSVNYNLHNNIDTDAFDIGVLSGEAGYAHLVNDLRLSYGLRGQLVELDGEEFQNSASLITTLQRSPGNGWSQAVTAAYSAVRYDDGINANASLRDVDQWLFSGILGKAMGNFNHTVSVYYGTEDEVKSTGKDNAQDFYGVAFSEQFQFRPEHIPYLRVSLHYTENKAPHVFFGKVRDDNTFSTSMGWIWRARRNMNITTDLTYTDNDSNLDLYEYDRLKLQTGLRYQF